MTTYTPKTNESDRKHLLQIHAELFPGPDVDTARNMTIDLYNCEACLREREEEIERLKAASCDDGCKHDKAVDEFYAPTGG